MKPPNGMAEVIAMFGDPAKYRTSDGRLNPQWEKQNIVRVMLPDELRYADDQNVIISRVAVHRLISDIAFATLQDVHMAGLWHHLNPYGGGYEPRLRRGSSATSLHTFGIALDFDPETYPLGSTRRMPKELVDIFASHGWMYGGNFKTRRDPMHFQFATGC